MSSAGGGGGEHLQVVLGAFAVGAGWGPAVSELYKCRQLWVPLFYLPLGVAEIQLQSDP